MAEKHEDVPKHLRTDVPSRGVSPRYTIFYNFFPSNSTFKILKSGIPKIFLYISWCFTAIILLRNADGMANSVHPVSSGSALFVHT